MSPRAASIDIGSNTTLFLVGDVNEYGKVIPVDEDKAANGIGKDVFDTGAIADDTVERNRQILTGLVRRAMQIGAEKIIIAGTSAVRNASNCKRFSVMVQSVTGQKMVILSGEEEARMTFLGSLSGSLDFSHPVTLVDIGGGSTEIILGRDRAVEESFSLEIGAVRLTGKFPLGDPPDNEVYPRMAAAISSELKSLISSPLEGRALILSGGTAATLATLKLRQTIYDGAAVEGAHLRRDWIESALRELLLTTLEARRRMLRFDPDRAEVIIAGTALALEIMRRLQAEDCRVTHRGLRFGLLADWALKQSGALL